MTCHRGELVTCRQEGTGDDLAGELVTYRQGNWSRSGKGEVEK